LTSNSRWEWHIAFPRTVTICDLAVARFVCRRDATFFANWSAYSETLEPRALSAFPSSPIARGPRAGV